MLLQLQLQTETDTTTPATPNVDTILQDVYAFVPAYKFTHIGNGVLQTVIDTAHDLTSDQVNLILNSKYTLTLVPPPASTTTPPAAG